ncbi:MAG: 50S ribosomal protein L25 [Planctomycetaceae bacterium]
MAEDPKLVARKREGRGTRDARRLRSAGVIPGNVYGHGTDPVAVAVAADQLTPILHSGHRVVDLELEGGSEKAMLREVQWDVWGAKVQHFDLLRVSADERVEVSVPIKLKGIAPGSLSGGHLEQPLHELNIECPALSIPDTVTLNINELQIGDAIHVGDIDPATIAEGVTVLDSPELVVVQVVETVEEEVVTEAATAEGAQPEVIGEKKEGEEGEGE